MHIYIADTFNNRIQIWDHNGNYVKQFGGFGVGIGKFISPRAITTNDTHIFVADSGNNRIQIFDNMGNYVNRFGSSGDANGEFDYPSGITTNKTHIYIADTVNHRIQIFKACQDGQLYDNTGACYTPEPFEFISIKSMYNVGEVLTGTLRFTNNITATNYIIIDGALDGITLNSNGTWAGEFLTPTNLGTHTIRIVAQYIVDDIVLESVKSFSFQVTLPCPVNQSFDRNTSSCIVVSFGSQGTASGKFDRPRAITTNNTHLYIADTENNRIQIFDINGSYITKFGSFGGGDRNFKFPNGITTNGTHLYIADTDNHRVQIFDINGNFVKSFGAQGNGDGQFNTPRAIATNNTHIYISDTNKPQSTNLG